MFQMLYSKVKSKQYILKRRISSAYTPSKRNKNAFWTSLGLISRILRCILTRERYFCLAFSVVLSFIDWRSKNRFHTPECKWFVLGSRDIFGDNVLKMQFACRYWMVTVIKTLEWTITSIPPSRYATFDLSLWSLQQTICAWEWQPLNVEVIFLNLFMQHYYYSTTAATSSSSSPWSTL